MLQTRARLLKRLALGVALLLAAAGVTFVIKDLLAAKEPQNSLPGIVVNYQGTPLPSVNYVQDSYSWRFINGAKTGHIPPEEYAAVDFAPVLPDAPMEVFFTYPPKDIVMSLAYGRGYHTEEDFILFEEYTENIGPLGPGRYVLYDNQYFYTPSEPGEYVIRIWADWGWRGSVLYYVKLVISEDWM